MFMLLGLGLDNIFTVKCWPSCLIIAQYYSLLLGNCHYNADQAGRPAYGGAMAWHLLTFHTDRWAAAWVSAAPASIVYASLQSQSHNHRHWKFCGKLPVSGDGLETFTPWLLQWGTVTGPSQPGVIWSLYLPAVCRCVCPLPTQTIKSGCQLGAIYGLLQKNNTAI